MTRVYLYEHNSPTGIPSFALHRQDGGQVALQDYYENGSLVLLFIHGADSQGKPCADCLDALHGFVDRMQEYLAQDAQILALAPIEPSYLAFTYPQRLYPFPVLADPGGKIRRKYACLMADELAPHTHCMTFVLDAYNVPYVAFIEPELDREELHTEILTWLQYIGIQCPE